ncbi:MAG: AbrB/MazE/SpoVT family DNA-binding domain-containing protein [Euryarchaeota archaeon]|nr:AbrB/MazE/SpoVT family DNA-binding domain-containing protein [Euryarchaeota archaeon]
MPLTRKTHLSGGSVVVTIPSQLVEAYDIIEGDEVEIIPLKYGELKIRKINVSRRDGGLK